MDYFFINETKKQFVRVKYLGYNFDNDNELIFYLAKSVGDTIRIVNECSRFYDDLCSGKLPKEFIEIELYKFNIKPDNLKGEYDEIQVDILYNQMNNK